MSGPQLVNLGALLISKGKGDPWDRTTELQNARANAVALVSQFATASPTDPKVFYFPEGRYYVGLPQGNPVEVVPPPPPPPLHEQPTPPPGFTASFGSTWFRYTSGEQMADLIIPPGATLCFGPGATLVPMAFTADEVRRYRTEAWIALRRAFLPEPERFRVRVEVQGAIDAPMSKIFDPYMDEDNVPSIMPQRSAGLVYFQRETVREVFPEWWGAIPMRGEDNPLTEGEVRRTTAALQASFDAAFNHRVTMPQRHYVDVPPTRPSLPVVLSNDYLIDRPLRVGLTLQQARARGSAVEAFPPNSAGFVMRGECGPTTRRGGGALLKASQWFQSELVPPGQGADARPPNLDEFGDSRSLLIVRARSACSLENVVFDAAEIAERCITVMTFRSAHHHALEGCELRNARYALLYVGGEFPPPDRVAGTMRYGQVIRTSLDPLAGQEELTSRYFSGGQDLADFRISRCRFLTGEGPGLLLPMVPFRKGAKRPGSARWKHGVVYRSEQGLASEFHGCVFEGRGSPMVLAVGGRLSFQNCSFRTDMLPGAAPVSQSVVPDQASYRWWNGTDIHIAGPFPEWLSSDLSGDPQFVFASTFTARNVESRSRQFLTTYPAHPDFMPHRRPVFASVTLIQVRHASDFPADDPSNHRPAIYWAGPRWDNCPLVLQSCLFSPLPSFGGSTPQNIFRGAVFIAPQGDPTLGDPRPVLLSGTRRVGGGALLGSTGSAIPAVMTIPSP